MAHPRRFPLVCLALVSLVALANAMPGFWAGKPGACGKHPNTGFGPHLAPSPDSNVVWTVTSGSSAASELCPGGTYKVTVSWGSSHHGYLTTSTGSWSDAPASSCPQSTWMQGGADSSMTSTLSVPCNAKGSIVLAVTHSMPGAAYLQSSKTFKINAGCAAASCSGTPASSNAYLTALAKVPTAKTFVALAKASKLLDKLGTATVIVPTDKAIAAFLKSSKLTAAQVLGNQALLRKVINYHIIPRKAYTASSLKNGASLKTALKRNLRVRKSGKVITLVADKSRVRVTKTYRAGKGSILLVNGVLVPK